MVRPAAQWRARLVGGALPALAEDAGRASHAVHAPERLRRPAPYVRNRAAPGHAHGRGRGTHDREYACAVRTKPQPCAPPCARTPRAGQPRAWRCRGMQWRRAGCRESTNCGSCVVRTRHGAWRGQRWRCYGEGCVRCLIKEGATLPAVCGGITTMRPALGRKGGLCRTGGANEALQARCPAQRPHVVVCACAEACCGSAGSTRATSRDCRRGRRAMHGIVPSLGGGGSTARAPQL